MDLVDRLMDAELRIGSLGLWPRQLGREGKNGYENEERENSHE